MTKRIGAASENGLIFKKMKIEIHSYKRQKHFTANVYRQTTDKLMFKSVISAIR